MNTLLDNVGSPVYYQNYPKLFHAYFSTIADSKFQQLSKAGYVYYQSVIILDRIVDDGKVENLPTMAKYQLYKLEFN
jgi:squalene-hopene/tetraprenyl-beta-curcumene cyclase